MPATPRRPERHEPTFHRYLRDNIIHFPENKPAPGAPQRRGRDHHDSSYVWLTRAAALGVERFIIDVAGSRANDDHAALGDWYLDEKMPERLTPVIDHVKTSGWVWHLG